MIEYLLRAIPRFKEKLGDYLGDSQASATLALEAAVNRRQAPPEDTRGKAQSNPAILPAGSPEGAAPNPAILPAGYEARSMRYGVAVASGRGTTLILTDLPVSSRTRSEQNFRILTTDAAR